MTTQTKPPSDLDLIRSETGSDGLTLPQSNDAQLWARFEAAALRPEFTGWRRRAR